MWIQSILLKDTNSITSDSSLKCHLIISVVFGVCVVVLVKFAVAILLVVVIVIVFIFVVIIVVIVVVFVVVFVVVVVVVVFFSNRIVVVISSHPLELLGRRWRLPIPAPTILDGPPWIQYLTIPAIPL